ncbi:MAG TPA: sensor histidine kinase [Actinomycetes bacterium]|nr:sensor histidine kinase [Actinomycetes bacterium]
MSSDPGLVFGLSPQPDARRANQGSSVWGMTAPISLWLDVPGRRAWLHERVSEQLRPPLTKRLRPWHWVVFDGVVAVVYAVALFGSAGPPPAHGLAPGAAEPLVAATVLALAARRLWPAAVLAVVQAGACALAVLGVGTLGFLAPAYVMYLIPLRLPRRRAVVALAVVLATTVASIAAGPPPPGANGGIVDIRLLTVTTVIAAAWAIGLAVRQQRAYTAGLREQAERRAQAQVAEERMRIARELHDVVAHGMSLIAVQAGVANHVIGSRPEEAARALASIEATSRAALGEMRRLLGVLRAADGARVDAALEPAPGLADLDQLVSRTAQAGVHVDLQVRGHRRELPVGVDLTAYRIVQEALTNVVKHADADATRVVVAYEDDAVCLEITDEGRGGLTSMGQGHGIIGMRERVGLYGGEFQAGPRSRHGFRVAARLPLEGPAA